jgi:hypothetical protein
MPSQPRSIRPPRTANRHNRQLPRCTRTRPPVRRASRSLPSSSAHAELRWIEARKKRLPALLRPLLHRYRRRLFDLLFATAADTLLTFGRDPTRLGAEIGFTLVLHTWTRELTFHPQVHAIVTGGGLDADADRWVSASQDYRFPVKALSAPSPTSAAPPTASPSRARVCSRSPTSSSHSAPAGREPALFHPTNSFVASCSTCSPNTSSRSATTGCSPRGTSTSVSAGPRRCSPCKAALRRRSPISAPPPAHSLREHNDDTTVDLTRPRCPNCGVRSLVLRGARRTGYRQLRRSDPPPDT